MAYEFKNLNEVPVQEKPTENTTVMAFEGGSPKQIPAGEFGGKGLLFELTEDDYTLDSENATNYIVTKNYDPLYDALMSGVPIVIVLKAPDGSGYSDGYIVPVFWEIMQDEGLLAFVPMPGGDQIILGFTNGSHHSTT